MVRAFESPHPANERDWVTGPISLTPPGGEADPENEPIADDDDLDDEDLDDEDDLDDDEFDDLDDDLVDLDDEYDDFDPHERPPGTGRRDE